MTATEPARYCIMKSIASGKMSTFDQNGAQQVTHTGGGTQTFEI